MKRLLCMAMALSMFISTSAFAYRGAGLGTMIRDYKVDIRVNNTNPEMALKKLTDNLISSNITKGELMDYVKNNLDEREFNNFINIVDYGKKEIQNVGQMDATEFQMLLSEAISASEHNTGANYVGCGMSYGFGVTAILAGVVLGLLALDAHGSFDGNDNDGVIFDDSEQTSSRTRNYAIAAGITGAVGIVLTIGASGAGCK